MRLWNLSESIVPEVSVLQSYGPPSKRRKRSERGRKPQPSRFTVALCSAALATTFAVGIVQASATTLRVPLSMVGVAQSTPEAKPPLSGEFKHEYSAEWTEELENQLLSRIEGHRLHGTSKPVLEQMIEAVFSNQTETPGQEAKALTRDQIEALAKAGKS